MLKPTLRWPAPRREVGWLRLARRIWTFPTTTLGHCVARWLTSEPPRRLSGPAAEAWLYLIPDGRRRISAITIGHVIIFKRERLRGLEGGLILAHELAHTRQHEWLGPLYLPLHAACEVTSAILARLLRAPPIVSAVHAYNPLEQTFICIGAGACRPLSRGELEAPFDVRAFMRTLGVDELTE